MATHSAQRLPRKRFIILVLLAVVITLGALSTKLLIAPAAKALPLLAPSTISYRVQDNDEQLINLLAGKIKQAGFTPKPSGSNATADLIVTTSREGDSRVIANRETGTPNALGSDTLVQPQKQPSAWLKTAPNAPAAAVHIADQLATSPITLSGSQPWTLIATSDIIIGRMVYWRMMQTGDMLMPFAMFRDTLKNADLTLGNLENSFSDTHPVISEQGMSFVSPTKAAAGLADSGIDAVNIANNHSYNGGASGFNETLDWLAGHNIAVFGGGQNDQAAHTPLIQTVKGTRVALLGYSSIAGSVAAGPTTPGMAYLSMAPWGTLDESQVERMEQDIREAKSKADVVLVYYHWGTEYTHDANADQRTVAHRAIDAGADVIVGTHPHVVQGVEWYHNRLITYSLGNFIFDQEWSVDTTRGALLSLSFSGSTVTSAKLIPYQIADYNQPRPATPEIAAAILSDINSHSWWSP